METIDADVQKRLEGYRNAFSGFRETLLANLVMLGEVPSPTFQEDNRIDMLQQRFSEVNLQDISKDAVGNGIAIIPGKNPSKNILLVAHADTVFPAEKDHAISILPDTIVGPGIGDNSLGLAILATMPQLVKRLGLAFESNLVLLGATKGLGRGNLQGIDFFLKNMADDFNFQAGVCIEGVRLGRLSISSIGMLRGKITCRVPESYDWNKFGVNSAVVMVNDVMNELLAMPMPNKRPKSSIVLGSVHGGNSYNVMATKATLRFEIRSESEAVVNDTLQRVEDIVDDVKARTGADVELDMFARRVPGGIPTDHPLARTTRNIMKSLGIEPRLSPSTSELAALIRQGIPGVTIGMTTGEHLNEADEALEIEPISTGIAQLLGVLEAIDAGVCDAGE